MDLELGCDQGFFWMAGGQLSPLEIFAPPWKLFY